MLMQPVWTSVWVGFPLFHRSSNPADMDIRRGLWSGLWGGGGGGGGEEEGRGKGRRGGWRRTLGWVG